MHATDRARDMAAALDRAATQAKIHARLLQHDAIRATLADRLDGLPRLRWSRPSGTGPAGVRGRAVDGDLPHRLAAVAAYAAAAGDKTIEVYLYADEAVAQTTAVLAGVPVIVETPIWNRKWWRRRPGQKAAEDIVAEALASLGSLVYVRRWDGCSFRYA